MRQVELKKEFEFMRPLLGAVAWCWGSIIHATMTAPDDVRGAALVALAFIAMDTATGLVTAVLTGAVNSRRMRTGLVAKAVQYALLLSLSSGAAYLAGAWMFVAGAWYAIVAVEAVSMLENLTRLEQHGGAKMGPAAYLLGQLRAIFGRLPEDHG